MTKKVDNVINIAKLLHSLKLINTAKFWEIVYLHGFVDVKVLKKVKPKRKATK